MNKAAVPTVSDTLSLQTLHHGASPQRTEGEREYVCVCGFQPCQDALSCCRPSAPPGFIKDWRGQCRPLL